MLGEGTGGNGSLRDSTVSDNSVRIDVLAGLLVVGEVGDWLTIRRIWVGPLTRTIS